MLDNITVDLWAVGFSVAAGDTVEGRPDSGTPPEVPDGVGVALQSGIWIAV